MKHIDAQDDLVEDFEPSALPPMGPDGAPQIPALRKETEPPPRLCEAGPCSHYHRFAIQMDAQRPIGDHVDEGGKIVGPAPDQPFYLRVHHYCYPTDGIETKLGDLPVLECNMWSPLGASTKDVQARAIADYEVSEDGKAWKARLEKWKAERMAEATDTPPDGAIDEAVLFVTMHIHEGCELLVFVDTGDNQERKAEPLFTLSETAARESFDTHYLKDTLSPGHYVAWIDAFDPQTKERIRCARKLFEVT